MGAGAAEFAGRGAGAVPDAAVGLLEILLTWRHGRANLWSAKILPVVPPGTTGENSREAARGAVCSFFKNLGRRLELAERLL